MHGRHGMGSGQPPCRGQWLRDRLRELDPPLEPDRSETSRRKRKGETSDSSFEGSWMEAVDLRRQLHSSDCIERLMKRLGVRCEGGTLIRNFAVDRRRLEAARKLIKREIDRSWAKLAVEEGVRLAKGGSYEEAIVSYDQATKLDPSNADARVARGAAHANRGNYREAVMDFDAALALQPDHRNAIEYRRCVTKRKRESENRREGHGTVTKGDDRLTYSHGLFGRGLPLKQSKPNIDDVRQAMDVLKENKQREKKKQKHRHRTIRTP